MQDEEGDKAGMNTPCTVAVSPTWCYVCVMADAGFPGDGGWDLREDEGDRIGAILIQGIGDKGIG